MIEVNNFTLKFDDKLILDNISFKCGEGQIIGLVGPSGIGKSSLIKSIVGIYEGDMGEILVNGRKIYDNVEVKKEISYVPDEHQSFNLTSLEEMVENYKIIYPNFSIKTFEEINSIFKIPLKKRYFNLSKGMKVRFNLLLALSLDSKVLILDEPFSGLDPILKEKVLKLIVSEASKYNKTILISSHNLIELERICDEVIMIDDGKIAYQNNLIDMKKNTKKIQVAFDLPVYVEDLINIEGIFKLSQLGRVFTIVTEKYDQEFIDKLNKFKPLFIEEIDLSLEEVFINKLDKEGDSYEKVFK